jgi:hypothetical protein
VTNGKKGRNLALNPIKMPSLRQKIRRKQLLAALAQFFFKE